MQADQIISLENFVTNADSIIKNLNASDKSFVLTKDDSAVAVLQNIKEHRKILNALYMLKLMVQSERDIQQGKGQKQSEVFEGIDRMLESKIG